MDQTLVASICSQVYQKFPEVRGIKPTVQLQGTGHLLIFKGKAATADGKSMPRIVRVVVDADGKIGKMTTSR